MGGACDGNVQASCHVAGEPPILIASPHYLHPHDRKKVISNRRKGLDSLFLAHTLKTFSTYLSNCQDRPWSDGDYLSYQSFPRRRHFDKAPGPVVALELTRIRLCPGGAAGNISASNCSNVSSVRDSSDVRESHTPRSLPIRINSSLEEQVQEVPNKFQVEN